MLQNLMYVFPNFFHVQTDRKTNILSSFYTGYLVENQNHVKKVAISGEKRILALKKTKSQNKTIQV